MKSSTLTVRIDDELKARATKACDYMGTTLSAVITHALRSEIDRYYKQRAQDTKDARSIADGENYQLMLNAALRENQILDAMGFTDFLDLNKPQKLHFYNMYYQHLRMLLNTNPAALFENVSIDIDSKNE